MITSTFNERELIEKAELTSSDVGGHRKSFLSDADHVAAEIATLREHNRQLEEENSALNETINHLKEENAALHEKIDQLKEDKVETEKKLGNIINALV